MPASRSSLPAWQKLVEHARAAGGWQLRELFRKDPARFQKFSLEYGGILFDWSKQLVTRETMELLLALARECRLEAAIERLLSGAHVNSTENRAALHTALRSAKPVLLDGTDVTRDVKTVLAAMGKLVRGLHAGRIKGTTGRPFTDAVSIGIGGSDLGPRFACQALEPYSGSRLRLHFVSNVDGAALSSVIAHLNPATTLFVVESKTFTTAETLANARSAKAWLESRLGRGKDVGRHFCAVTAAPARAADFGVPRDRIFPMWDWVGGRFSMWSAIGLPIALAIGAARFNEMRAGARLMDDHFTQAPLERNLPVIMALVESWNLNFLGRPTRAVLPYDERLRLLPAYLQQLEMESCGKSVTHGGERVGYTTAPVVWGSAGTDGQHAYFQMLHQGTQAVAMDFIACCRPHHRLRGHHENLLANFMAQTEALAFGLTEHEAAAAMREDRLPEAEITRLAPHRTFPGNRASNSILLDALSPKTLGALIALHEHKVFVQSVLWDINAFDQWGVELGKKLANRILPELSDTQPVSGHDGSTNALITHYKSRKRK